MTLIKDLINIPERVHSGDLVLKLSDGLANPDRTVSTYVVTPQLVKCFSDALALVKSALQQQSSLAAYLHGSFGSGKSHFMAVLDLLLSGNTSARSIPELGKVVADLNTWADGKRFLLVPFHMIGATDMESAILGGYADHVRRIHPDQPGPGIYHADKLFHDARNMRDSMGDEAFFNQLNSGRSAGDGWGALEAGWDAGSFTAAMAADARSEARTSLVADLVETTFTAMRGASEFVSLDDGLAIISAHAKSLGYDALILFLDELILWLASHAADQSFVNREGQKLAKLVEAQRADRPAPIVSFVARQRDLKELMSDHVTGSQLLSFADVLNYWEARFGKILLEDRNLPVIAEKRILAPKSEAARAEIDKAFADTTRIRGEVIDVLQTPEGDRDTFRKLYPFSPALVEVLIVVSFALQRERTALKVMLQLLANQRETLELGQIIPVGDLFDVVAEGNDAFSESIRAQFDTARKLYELKLRPLVEAEHAMTFDQLADLPATDQAGRRMRADDRLVKTLLLAALAPNVNALKSLTARRLAALNWGTFTSPIPGREAQTVLTKCRKWAASVGEIKIGDDPTDPTVAIQLSGVDTDFILRQAMSEDNRGNQVRKIKSLLFKELGIDQRDELFQRHDFTWRATKRACEVRFANIRELTNEAMTTTGSEWRVIIDYPFDPENFGPSDDINRIDRYLSEHASPSRTLVWVPSFLSRRAQQDLGTLVKLDHVLNPERFRSFTEHLSEVERAQARIVLENQRGQLEQQMRAYLEGAYGVLPNPVAGTIDETHSLELSEHFRSLDGGFTVQPPAMPNFRTALANLLDQSLRHQFPKHPQFDDDANLSRAALKRVWEIVEAAAGTPDGRLSVAADRRKEVRHVANPLKVGEMAETHFVLGHHWKSHFDKKHAEHGGQLTVGRLRSWIDEPEPMGLPVDLSNLVILAFAAQTNRAFVLAGVPVASGIDNLLDELELREETLPSQQNWTAALKRAAAVFGIAGVGELCNAANVAKLAEEVRKQTAEFLPGAERLESKLAARLAAVGVEASAKRLATAREATKFLKGLSGLNGHRLAEMLATVAMTASPEAIASSFKKSGAVGEALDRTNWDLIGAASSLEGERAASAAALKKKVADALASDEIAVGLVAVLVDAEKTATQLLAAAAAPSKVGATAASPVVPVPPPIPPDSSGRKAIASESRSNLDAKELESALDEIRNAMTKRSRANISWEVFEE